MPVLPPEAAFAVPLKPKTRAVAERLVIPAEGLEAWLAAGFQYRIEATDNAEPDRQTGRSPWRQYVPGRKGRGQPERSALLEPERARRPRSLLRPDALSRIPDLTPDELAQLGDLGRGVPPPRQLQRPSAERLQDRQNASAQGGPQAPGGAVGQPPSAVPRESQPGLGAKVPQGPSKQAPPQESYDLPQGLPAEKQGEQPPPPKAGAGGRAGDHGGEGGQAQGKPEGPPSAGGRGEGSGQARGLGPKGAGQPRGKSAGDGAAGGPDGPGSDADGGVIPGTAGPGGRRPRDGGWKTGRETGPSTLEMAPPDLESLARLKEVSLEEARRYAQQAGLVSARTDFGDLGAPARSPSSPAGQREPRPRAPLQLREGAVPRAPPAGAGERNLPFAPRLPQAEVDPLYRAVVEGYFRRLSEWQDSR
jgi:hypothetical protein